MRRVTQRLFHIDIAAAACAGGGKSSYFYSYISIRYLIDIIGRGVGVCITTLIVAKRTLLTGGVNLGLFRETSA